MASVIYTTGVTGDCRREQRIGCHCHLHVEGEPGSIASNNGVRKIEKKNRVGFRKDRRFDSGKKAINNLKARAAVQTYPDQESILLVCLLPLGVVEFMMMKKNYLYILSLI